MSNRIRNTSVVVLFDTRPDAALENVTQILNAGVSVVSGTTGWNDLLPKAQALAKENPVYVEVLRRIARQHDGVLYLADAEALLAGLHGGQTALKKLQTAEGLYVLRAGTRLHPGRGSASYVSIQDPVLGWLVSTSERVPQALE